MVNVLVIRLNFRGFKSGGGDGFLRAIKISSTSSFGGEVKLEAPWRKILLHIKITSNYEQKYFARPNP
jgi:hypothetical protein